MTTEPTTTIDDRERADGRGADVNRDALQRYERQSGVLRCDSCGDKATTVTITRRGQRNSFSGTCLIHTPTPNTVAGRKLALDLIDRANKMERLER
jgi:hypothetical protein